MVVIIEVHNDLQIATPAVWSIISKLLCTVLVPPGTKAKTKTITKGIITKKTVNKTKGKINQILGWLIFLHNNLIIDFNSANSS